METTAKIKNKISEDWTKILRQAKFDRLARASFDISVLKDKLEQNEPIPVKVRSYLKKIEAAQDYLYKAQKGFEFDLNGLYSREVLSVIFNARKTFTDSEYEEIMARWFRGTESRLKVVIPKWKRENIIAAGNYAQNSKSMSPNDNAIGAMIEVSSGLQKQKLYDLKKEMDFDVHRLDTQPVTTAEKEKTFRRYRRLVDGYISTLLRKVSVEADIEAKFNIYNAARKSIGLNLVNIRQFVEELSLSQEPLSEKSNNHSIPTSEVDAS